MTVKDKKRYIIFLLTLFLITLSWSGWIKKTVGTSSSFFDIKIGNGRNDGVLRVYCSCTNTHVVEWTYYNNTDTWEMVDCGSIPAGSDDRMMRLCIGNGREDGVNRVYTTSANGNVYEFTYSGSTWEMKELGAPISIYTGITIAKARNDNRNRIYAGGYETPVCEFTWNGSSWDMNNLSNEIHYIWPLAVAQARNDGIERVYCPDWSLSCLREYTWNGSSYEEVVINTSKNLCNAVVGSGRNDGINRVYAACYLGHIYEFTYSLKGWDTLDIHPDAAEMSRYGLCLGRTRVDGKFRLYSGATSGDVREHSWNGNFWSDSAIDAVTGATAYLTIGSGRNDDTVRIYATNVESQLYEFTNTSPFVDDTTSIVSKPVINTNNTGLFFSGNVISYSIPKSGNVRLALYRLSGKEVCCLKDEFQPAGAYTINAPWKDESKSKLPSGIYIFGLKFIDSQEFLKIVRLK